MRYSNMQSVSRSQISGPFPRKNPGSIATAHDFSEGNQDMSPIGEQAIEGVDRVQKTLFAHFIEHDQQLEACLTAAVANS